MTALPRSLRRGAGRLALAAWFSGLLVLSAGLLARHAVALPGPGDSGRLGSALGALRAPDQRGRWLAVHVLSSACRCSQGIADHLVTSPRPAGWSELVLWTGDDPPPPSLAAHGFTVKTATTADLTSSGVEAVPLLVALDPSDHVLYAGGYTERKQGPDVQDLRILEAARATAAPPPLPIFGCAASDRLRRALSALPVP